MVGIAATRKPTDAGARAAGPPPGRPTPPAAPVRAGRGAVSFWRKAYVDGITGLAGMVAYNLLLSIFPVALIALFVASQVLAAPQLERTVLIDLSKLFPSATETTLTQALADIRSSSTTVGIVALISSVWVGASFWGSLDTAFCRIYHVDCRSWLAQKRFALVMLLVALALVGATLLIPVAQSLLVSGADDLPFGLDRVRGVIVVGSVAAGLLLIFLLLCIVYWAVPNRRLPWSSVWPGALAATLAMGAVDYAFPVYLQNVNTLASFGTTFVFVIIVLLWFYVLAIIILGGAVVNALRYELHDTGELSVAS
jgi:membrane protein